MIPLTAAPSIYVISDFRDGWPPSPEPESSPEQAAARWRRTGDPPGPVGDVAAERDRLAVVGGYLERLPLACVKHGLADHAEIWSYWRPSSPAPFQRDGALLARRGFHIHEDRPPFHSSDMLGFVRAFGAPHILCVWGLGVDAALLDACGASFKIYNSIDAPALRVPQEVSEKFDLVLTGADWQTREVQARHPGMACAELPIGPEFADPETFRPLGLEKPYDLIYVAAAQPYKRHDILFAALEKLPRDIRTLCVFGYGEMGDALRQQAARAGLAVDFVGPPGVGFAEVNRLMNLARIGLVCGIDDGAPAILTEYMLAGLPVLANAGLRCGLQYITPQTGMAADPDRFDQGIRDILGRHASFNPRQTVLDNWTWPHSVRRLENLMRR
jgi:glycosyltransferase involved in cell wall biosynthesis